MLEAIALAIAFGPSIPAGSEECSTFAAPIQLSTCYVTVGDPVFVHFPRYEGNAVLTVVVDADRGPVVIPVPPPDSKTGTAEVMFPATLCKGAFFTPYQISVVASPGKRVILGTIRVRCLDPRKQYR